MAEGRRVAWRLEGRVAVVAPRTLSEDGALADLAATVGWLDGSEDVGAMVLDLPPGEGFPHGAATGPGFDAVIAGIDAARHPVVVALSGTATGPAAHLALAGHWRVGSPEAGLGFAEVGLGVLPGAGVVRHLVSVAGVALAVDLLLGGRTIAAPEAAACGILDALGHEDAVAAAIALARALVARGAGPRPTRTLRRAAADPRAGFVALRAARAESAADRRSVVPLILSCVEAALLLPWSRAAAFEADAGARARAQPQARALAHVARAEAADGGAMLGPGPDGRPAPTSRARAAALRQLEAVAQAAGRLARALGQDVVDGAMVSAGFEEGPFGGRTPVPDRAIWRALLAVAVAEGAAMVEEGLLPSAGAVDLAAIHAGGMPRLIGGPMWAGRQAGPVRLLRELALLRAADPEGGWPALDPLARWAAGVRPG